MKKNLYQEILRIVSQVSELPEAVIVGHEQMTDILYARWILYKQLFANGYNIAQIVKLTGKSRCSVSNGLAKYDAKMAERVFLELALQVDKRVKQIKL